jgi:hypothetical protein
MNAPDNHHIQRLRKDDQELYALLSLAYLARLSQDQLARLLHASPRTIRRRLSQDDDSFLKKGWVQRLDLAAYDDAEQLPRRQASLWALTDEGHSQIRSHPQYPMAAIGHALQYPARPSLARKRTIFHDLQVAESVITLIAFARTGTRGLSGVFTRFEMRLDPNQPAPIADAVVGMHLVPPQQRSHPVPWVRDLPTRDERWHVFALEIDMGTEALSVIQGKALHYRQLFADERWQAAWCRRFGKLPLILWIVPTAQRRDAIYRIWRDVWSARRYLIASFDDLADNYWLGHIHGKLDAYELFVPIAAVRPPPPALLPPPEDPPPALPAAPEPAPDAPGQQRLLPADAAPDDTVPTEPAPPVEPPMYHGELAMTGVLADGTLTGRIGPLTVVFAEDFADPLLVIRYANNSHRVAFPCPTTNEVQVWIPRHNVRTTLPLDRQHLHLTVSWPPPRPRPLPAWNASPELVQRHFAMARRRILYPRRLLRLLLATALRLARDWKLAWRVLGVIWLRGTENGLPYIMWWFLAPGFAVVMVAYTPLLAMMLVGLYSLALLLWLPQLLIWSAATLWRCRSQNPYHPWLRRLTLSLPWLLGILLLLLGWRWFALTGSFALISQWFQ